MEAHIPQGYKAPVKEKEHPKEEEKKAKAGKANANLCVRAMLFSRGVFPVSSYRICTIMLHCTSPHKSYECEDLVVTLSWLFRYP